MSTLTWFVVSDAHRARVFSHSSETGEFSAPLQHDYIAPGARDRDRYADRAGRVHQRVGPGRHSVEPPTSPADHAEQDLARRVAQDLSGLVQRHQIDRLVLVASPHMLGSLRDAMDKATRARVVGEHTKDLTKLTDHQLHKRLGEYLQD